MKCMDCDNKKRFISEEKVYADYLYDAIKDEYKEMSSILDEQAYVCYECGSYDVEE